MAMAMAMAMWATRGADAMSLMSNHLLPLSLTSSRLF